MFSEKYVKLSVLAIGQMEMGNVGMSDIGNKFNIILK